MRSNPRRTLLAAAVAAAVLLAPAQPASAEPPCETADALFAATQLGPARTEYLNLLEGDPDLECALDGFEATATAQRAAKDLLEQGRDAEDLDDDETALVLYIEALGTDATLVEAQTALLALLQEDDETAGSGDAYPKARALLRLGLTETALEQLKKSIGDEEGPIEDVPEDLLITESEELVDELYAPATNLLDAGYRDKAREEAQRIAVATGTEIPEPLQAEDDSITDKLKNWLEAGATWVAAFAIAMALILILVGLYSRLLKPRVQESSRPLVFEEISSPKGGPDVGSALSVMLATQVRGAAQPGDLVGYLSYNETPVVEEVELPEQLKPLGSFFKWLNQPNTVRLTGEAYFTPTGVGLTLALVDRKNRVQRSREFTRQTSINDDAPDTDKAALFYALLPDAAAWARHALARLRGEAPQFLGTSEWRSYASFTHGSNAVREGQTDGARLRFLDALQKDPDNVAALFNVAKLDFDEAGKRDWSEDLDGLETTHREALDLLGEVLDKCGGPDVTGIRRDPIWYRAGVLAVIVQLNRVASLRAVDDVDTKRRTLIVANLLGASWALRGSMELAARRINPADDEDAELRDLLRQYRREFAQLELGILAEAVDLGLATDREFEARYKAHRLRTPQAKSAQTHYGDACVHAARRGSDDEWESKALNSLRSAISLHPEVAKFARYDVALQPLIPETGDTNEFSELVAETPPIPPLETSTNWTVTIY